MDTGENTASSVISDTGTGSISGNPFHPGHPAPPADARKFVGKGSPAAADSLASQVRASRYALHADQGLRPMDGSPYTWFAVTRSPEDKQGLGAGRSAADGEGRGRGGGRRERPGGASLRMRGDAIEMTSFSHGAAVPEYDRKRLARARSKASLARQSAEQARTSAEKAESQAAGAMRLGSRPADGTGWYGSRHRPLTTGAAHGRQGVGQPKPQALRMRARSQGNEAGRHAGLAQMHESSAERHAPFGWSQDAVILRRGKPGDGNVEMAILEYGWAADEWRKASSKWRAAERAWAQVTSL